MDCWDDLVLGPRWVVGMTWLCIEVNCWGDLVVGPIWTVGMTWFWGRDGLLGGVGFGSSWIVGANWFWARDGLLGWLGFGAQMDCWGDLDFGPRWTVGVTWFWGQDGLLRGVGFWAKWTTRVTWFRGQDGLLGWLAFVAEMDCWNEFVLGRDGLSRRVGFRPIWTVGRIWSWTEMDVGLLWVEMDYRDELVFGSRCVVRTSWVRSILPPNTNTVGDTFTFTLSQPLTILLASIMTLKEKNKKIMFYEIPLFFYTGIKNKFKNVGKNCWSLLAPRLHMFPLITLKWVLPVEYFTSLIFFFFFYNNLWACNKK